MRSPWAFRDGCAREVDCHTLRVLSLQVYGQQHTLLCDNDSAAGRGRPLVILCAPAAPESPGVSGHRDIHRGRTGCTSRLGAIAARHTGDRDAAWHGPPEIGVVSVPKALQVS